MKRAFTLIELLTVIAIIAILAALLFPVFSTLRENARQSNTLSNMHTIYVAVKQFYEDEQRMPPTLFGYAETRIPNANFPNPIARPTLPSDNVADILPMDRATGFYTSNPGGSSEANYNRGNLYREQIRDYVTFTNVVNRERDKRTTTVVYWPINSPLAIANGSAIQNGELVRGLRVDWAQTPPPSSTPPAADTPCPVYGDTDIPIVGTTTYVGQPKLFYTMDAADIGPMIDPQTGQQVVIVQGDQRIPVYELHYTPDWTRRLGVRCEQEFANTWANGLSNSERLQRITAQLKYRNPPADRTIVTYSTHHAAFANSPNIPVLLWSGTARKLNLRNLNQLPLSYAP